jgi:hypothetical protein
VIVAPTAIKHYSWVDLGRPETEASIAEPASRWKSRGAHIAYGSRLAHSNR